MWAIQVSSPTGLEPEKDGRGDKDGELEVDTTVVSHRVVIL